MFFFTRSPLGSMRSLPGRKLLSLCLVSALWMQSIHSSRAASPLWWRVQAATSPDSPDDFAIANIGQLKTLAAKAADELNRTLQIGAGEEITHLIASWRATATGLERDDFAAVTLGQLKTVAKLFHDRVALARGNVPAIYPWGVSPADDYAVVNLGQVKTVFAFEVPDIPWRLGNPQQPYPDDLNRDGISDAYVAAQGTAGLGATSDVNHNGLQDFIELWNEGLASSPEDQKNPGLHLVWTSKSGWSEANGIYPYLSPPSLDLDTYEFFASENVHATLNSSLTSDVTRTYYSDGTWHTSRSLDDKTFNQMLTATFDVLNPIITSAMWRNGEDDRSTTISLQAQVDGRRNASSVSTSIWGAISSSTVETWYGSGVFDPEEHDFTNIWDFRFFDGEHEKTYTYTNGGGSSTSSTTDTFGFGMPTSSDPESGTISASLISMTSSASGTLDDGQTQWSRNYSRSHTLSGRRGTMDLVGAAKGDMSSSPVEEGESLLASPGEPGHSDFDIGSSSNVGLGRVYCSSVTYQLEYRVPGGLTRGLPDHHLTWFEITRHIPLDDWEEHLSVTRREETLRPGGASPSFTLTSIEGHADGFAETLTAVTGYVNSEGKYIDRLTPTSSAPGVSVYVSGDVTISGTGPQTVATIPLAGFAGDAIAASLPPLCGADLTHVTLYANGEIVAEDLALTPSSAGFYSLPPLNITVPVSKEVTIEARTTANLAGKIGHSGFILRFNPVLGDAPQAQQRSIHARLRLPPMLSDTALDTIQVLPIGDAQTGVQTAVETAPDSNLFVVAATGMTVSLPEGFIATGGAQQLLCHIPTTGGGGPAVLVPGSSSILCPETGSQTNEFTYSETTPGFKLPQPVLGWTYAGHGGYVPSETVTGDFAPFSYRTAAYNPAIIETSPVPGAPSLPGLTPTFADGRLFKAFLIQQPSGTGYDVVYGNFDTGALIRAPFGGSITAQVSVGGISHSGASVGLWSLQWQDSDGLPSAGPGRITASALVDYVARTDHGGVELPEDLGAYLSVVGLPNGHGVKVSSSEGVDSFTLVPPTEAPSGNIIVRRLAPLEGMGSNALRSTHKIIIYESSPGIERITDQEWKKLKELGFLAVHNQTAIASIMALGASSAGIGGTTLATELEDLHHLFQTFRGSDVMSERATKFWKELGINVDDFTVAWKKSDHLAAHGIITEQWRDFIRNNSHPDGTPLNAAIGRKTIKRRAIDLMFQQCATHSISVEDVQQYSRKALKGSMLNRLARLDAFDLKLTSPFSKRLAYKTRWESIAKVASNRLGVSILKRGILRYPMLLISPFYLLAGNPAGAMEAATGIPRASCQALLDAGYDNVYFGMPEPKGWPAFSFRDGSVVRVGDPWEIYVVDLQSMVVHEVIEGTVTDLFIVENGLLNKVEVQVSVFNPELGLNEILKFHVTSVPELLYDVGEVIPDTESHIIFPH